MRVTPAKFDSEEEFPWSASLTGPLPWRNDCSPPGTRPGLRRGTGPRGETDDCPSLVLLIQQHEAGMHAAALGIRGHGADSEDATLTAVSRIGELRDPALAGAWLRAIVRNRCLKQLRSRRDVPVTADDLPLASG